MNTKYMQKYVDNRVRYLRDTADKMFNEDNFFEAAKYARLHGLAKNMQFWLEKNSEGFYEWLDSSINSMNDACTDYLARKNYHYWYSAKEELDELIRAKAALTRQPSADLEYVKSILHACVVDMEGELANEENEKMRIELNTYKEVIDFMDDYTYG